MDPPRAPQASTNTSGALQPIQPTFDVWSISAAAATKVLETLRACAEDNIQGLVLFPLTYFGALITADKKRITEGQHILNKSESKLITFLKIVIGLSGQGLARKVAQDHHLIGTFQFAIACSPTLTVEETGKLIHEMMLLDKSTESEMVGSAAVSQFVRSLIAYGDFIEENPQELYTKIGDAVLAFVITRQALPGLWDPSPVESLAKLFHKVFESLQDMDNKNIILEGSHSGLLIATLFCWLRPEETHVHVEGTRILPIEGEKAARLSINLVRHKDGRATFGVDARWKMYKWRSAKDLRPIEERPPDDEENLDEAMRNGRSHNHIPMSSARNHMEGSGAEREIVEAAGHLAGALIDLTFEHGYICSSDRSSVLPLKEICSDYFQNSYHTIMKLFGWENLDLNRQKSIGEALKSRLKNVPDRRDGKDDVEFLSEALYDCQRHYFDTYGQVMLFNGDGDFTDAVERAIHLATEALFFSLCFKHPKRAMYRPFTTDRLRKNAKILRSLLSVPPIPVVSRGPEAGRGVPFWDFRAQVIQAMLQGATEVGPADLVVSSNGYVAYPSVLLNMEMSATDKRKTSALCIVPGRLRLQNGGPCFDRLVWKQETSIISGRQLKRFPEAISLFSRDKAFRGLDQDDAIGKYEVNVEHLVSAYHDQALRDILYLTTYMHLGSDADRLFDLGQSCTFEVRIPTNWIKSMEAVLFASHVTEYTLAPAQERSLAQRWREKGYLDQLAWNYVGQSARPGRRCVSTTCYKEQLRFFEAGNLMEGRKVFIRQKDVPLVQCLKEAFESCEDNPDWVVIS